MTRYLINAVVFLAGLTVVCWVAAGYAGTNNLALAATLLIGAFYLAGAVELQCYQRATATLAGAAGKLSAPPSSLDDWLAPLHPSLRNTVRLRVEGERAALPGPSLTPYLVGLLVLLGMLGTFLGMVATLKGTGSALESATDLQAIRASLAAPVRGLGFAFGTSIAGVATSAMLGLLSALARRDRILAGQALDARIATTLRVFSPGHRRDEGFRLLQRQAEAMPLVVDRLQALMTAMEQHSMALNERLASGQEALQGKTEAAYTRLAASFEQALATSAAASANAAGAAIRPAVETTMASLGREATALHDTVTRAAQQQLDGLSKRFEDSTTAVARIWTEALDTQRHAHETQNLDLRASLEGFAATFEQRSAGLLDGMAERTDKLIEGVSTRSAALMDGIAERSTGVLDQLTAGSTRVLEGLSDQSTNVLENLSTRAAGVLEGFSEHSAVLVHDYSERQQAAADAMAQAWDQAMARQESTGRKLTEDNQAALTAAVAAIEQRGTALLQATGQHGTALLQATERHGAAVLQAAEQRGADLLQATEQSQAKLRGDWAAQEQQRLAAWTESLAAIAAALRSEWQQAGAASAASQREVCDTLARTAQDISAQTQAHASETIAEIEKLVQAASEAPKAAADVVAELRQKLSDSMVRDNTMLEERGRLLETLGTLLDAVNHASTEQRQAVDALVSTSADLLDRVGTRFTEQVDTVGGRFTHDVERVGTQFTSDVARVGSELAGNVERVGIELTTNIGRVGTAFTDTVEKVGTSFTDSVERFGTAFTDNVEKVGSRFTEDVDRVGVRFAEEFDRVAGRFTEEVDRAGTGFTGQVDAARERFAGDVESAGSRFAEEVASRTGELSGIAAQVTGSAVEVASLGDAFGAAVKLFSQSNEQLVAHLQRIESALTRSITRSDEQLAYYVAQAREIVDLSTLSQKQIIENLQSMAGQQAASGTEAA